MPRWNQPPASGPERDRLDREAAAEVYRRFEAEMVNYTILPEDQRHERGRADLIINMGTPELMALAPESLEKSAAYAAVNTMQAQDFMITLPDGTKATLPSTGSHWLGSKGPRQDAALAKQLQSATLPPKPGMSPRGRPRTDGADKR